MPVKWKSTKKWERDRRLGFNTRIQHSGSEGQLYGEKNENGGVSRKMAAVVDGFNIVGGEKSQDNSN